MPYDDSYHARLQRYDAAIHDARQRAQAGESGAEKLAEFLQDERAKVIARHKALKEEHEQGRTHRRPSSNEGGIAGFIGNLFTQWEEVQSEIDERMQRVGQEIEEGMASIQGKIDDFQRQTQGDDDVPSFIKAAAPWILALGQIGKVIQKEAERQQRENED
jgi:hypothetical protein